MDPPPPGTCHSASTISSRGILFHLNQQLALRLQCASESPGGLLKHGLLDPPLRIPDGTGLSWDLRICFFMFPGHTSAAGQAATL